MTLNDYQFQSNPMIGMLQYSQNVKAAIHYLPSAIRKWSPKLSNRCLRCVIRETPLYLEQRFKV